MTSVFDLFIYEIILNHIGEFLMHSNNSSLNK